MEQNKKSYNQIASKWHETRRKMNINQCLVEFSTYLPINGTILDIGCGAGVPVAKYYGEQGFKVTGIDFSDEMISIAKEMNLINCEFILCDFFDFKSKQLFDGIIAFDSLFHFSIYQQSLVYSKLTELLKVDGYLIFTHGRMKSEITSEMFDNIFYYSALDSNELRSLLTKSNFKIIVWCEDYHDENGNRDLLIVAKKVK